MSDEPTVSLYYTGSEYGENPPGSINYDDVTLEPGKLNVLPQTVFDKLVAHPDYQNLVDSGSIRVVGVPEITETLPIENQVGRQPGGDDSVEDDEELEETDDEDEAEEP